MTTSSQNFIIITSTTKENTMTAFKKTLHAFVAGINSTVMIILVILASVLMLKGGFSLYQEYTHGFTFQEVVLVNKVLKEERTKLIAENDALKSDIIAMSYSLEKTKYALANEIAKGPLDKLVETKPVVAMRNGFSYVGHSISEGASDAKDFVVSSSKGLYDKVRSIW